MPACLSIRDPAAWAGMEACPYRTLFVICFLHKKKPSGVNHQRLFETYLLNKTLLEWADLESGSLVVLIHLR